MRELDRRIAGLRLRLAEIRSRQDQLRGLQRQFRSQLDKVMDFAVYEKGDLDSALSMAEEVDSRLTQTERAMHYLETILARGQEELDALLLTRSIEEARSEVEELEARRRQLEAEIQVLTEPGAMADGHQEDLAQLESQYARIGAEIRRLRDLISRASDEAARTVSSRVRR